MSQKDQLQEDIRTLRGYLVKAQGQEYPKGLLDLSRNEQRKMQTLYNRITKDAHERNLTLPGNVLSIEGLDKLLERTSSLEA
jgi:hypothetical protein